MKVSQEEYLAETPPSITAIVSDSLENQASLILVQQQASQSASRLS